MFFLKKILRKNKFLTRRRHGVVVNLKPSPRWKKLLLFFSGLLIGSVLLFVVDQIFIKAEVADFHPATCLGSWQNPENAQGRPENLDNQASSSFAGENSAVFTETENQIFCGQFLPSDYDGKGEIKSVGLTLVWGAKNLDEPKIEDVKPQFIEVSASTSTASSTGPVDKLEENNKSSTTSGAFRLPFVELAFAHDVSGSMLPVAPSEPVMPSETSAPASDNAVISPAPALDSPKSEGGVKNEAIERPTSGIIKEEKPVTDKTDSEPEATPEITVSTTSTFLEIIGPAIVAPLEPITSSSEASTTADLFPTSTASATPLEVTPPPMPDNNFLEVRYSFDGQTWLPLQKVGADNFRNLTITLPSVTWEELRKIQVGVFGIPSALKKLPKVYLDGMLLEVHYDLAPILQKAEKKVEKKPVSRVILPPGMPVIVLLDDQKPVTAPDGRENFKADGTADFDFDLEKLPAETPPVANLVPILNTTSTVEATSTTNSSTAPTSLEPSANSSTSQENTTTTTQNNKKGFFRSLAMAYQNLVVDLQKGRDFFSLNRLVARADVLVNGEGEMLTAENPMIAQVVDDKDQPTDFQPNLLTVNNKLRITFSEPSRDFKPGKYKMKLWILRNGAVYYSERDFLWGVMAINFNKSVYEINDLATIGFGVLDNAGRTICNATIGFEIKTPGGKNLSFSTKNGTVEKMGSCGPNTVTNEPDYKATLALAEVGIYRLEGKVKTTGDNSRIIDEVFEVKDSVPFEVERSGPTRIYPPESYTMKLKILANQDFAGVIKEYIPTVFDASSDGTVLVDADLNSKILRWAVDMKRGEMRELSYTFKAPNISPEFYKLGPLVFDDGTNVVWQEARQWQLAADSIDYNGTIIAYGEPTSQDNLLVRFATSTSIGWNASGTTLDVTAETFQIKHVVVRAAPTRNEYIVGQLKAGGRLDFEIYNGNTGTWSLLFGVASTTATQVCDSVLGACDRSFDIAYGQLSGTAMMVYGGTKNGGGGSKTIRYVTWDGNVTSSVSTYTFPGSAGLCLANNSCNGWVKLVSKGDRLADNRSNEMMLLWVDGVRSLYAVYWDGAQFSTTSTLTTNAPLANGESFDGAWEAVSGNFVAAFASGTASGVTPFYYKTFTNGVWDVNPTSLGTVSSSVGAWVQMAADPSSNRIFVGLTASTTVAAQTDGWPAIWKGDGSTAGFTLGPGDMGLRGKQSPEVIGEWLSYATGTPKVVAIFNTNGATDTAYYRTWTQTEGWSASSSITAFGNRGGTRKLVAYPNDLDEITLYGVDLSQNLVTEKWGGSSWSATSAILSTQVGTSTIWGGANGNSWENNAFDFVYKPYSPWSLNWRLYSGTSTADTPTPALANENTSSTGLNPLSGKVRLRINVAELSGGSESGGNYRKGLQFTTSSSPDASSTSWTNVGDIGSAVEWRYYDCDTGSAICNDGGVIAATVLSSSTTKGWWNTSSTTVIGTANMNQASSTVTELEFPIQANNATVNQLYYFRIYESSGQGSGTATIGHPIYRQQTSWPATPCSSNSVCSYPSLQTGPSPIPAISNLVLNGGNSIVLTEGTTTPVTVSFTVTDGEGCSDVFTNGGVTTTVYRSGMGTSCVASNQNCYITATTTNSCAAGNSANATATVNIYYFAEATDATSTYAAQNWLANVAVRDASNYTDTTTTLAGVELLSLLAFQQSTTTFNFGTISPSSTSGAVNQFIGFKNTGNTSGTISAYATAMTSGLNTFATSSMCYNWEVQFSLDVGAYSCFTDLSNPSNLATIITLLRQKTAVSSTLGSWSSTTAMPSPLYSQGGVVTYCGSCGSNTGDIVLLGGLTTGDVRTSTILTNTINFSGTLNSWSVATNSLPYAVSGHGATRVSYGSQEGYVYVVGGNAPTGNTSTVIYATSTASLVGAWKITSVLPAARTNLAVANYNGHIYAVGGYNSAPMTSVYYSAINYSDGTLGAWSSATALPTGRSGHAAVAYGDHLYVIGGRISIFAVTSSVIYAHINSDGTLGSWSDTTALPNNLGYEQAVARDGALYVLGGDTSIGVPPVPTSTVLYATINSNGTLGNWQETTALPQPIDNFVALGLPSSRSTLTNEEVFVFGGATSTSNPTSTVMLSILTNPMSEEVSYFGLKVPNGTPAGTYNSTVVFSISTFSAGCPGC